MKRRILAVLAALGVAASLAACSGVEARPSGHVAPSESVLSGISVGTVDLPDGRQVTCVVSDGIRERGISCDWPSIAGTRP